MPYLPDDAFQTLVLIVAVAGHRHTGQSLVHGGPFGAGRQVGLLATLNLRMQFYRRTLQMEIARFGNEGTSDLMNRFTSDMESLSAGLNELFGKLVREPLKMIACLIGAAVVCWRLLVFSLILRRWPPFLWLAGQDPQASQSAGHGRDVGDVQHA